MNGGGKECRGPSEGSRSEKRKDRKALRTTKNESLDENDSKGKSGPKRHNKMNVAKKEESVEQLLKKKTVMQVIEILNKRVNERMAKLENFNPLLTPLKQGYSGFPNRPACSDHRNRNPEAKQYEEEDKQSPMEVEWPTVDQGQQSRQTPAGSEHKYADKNVVELEKEIFADNHKKVMFSDFKGLEEAILEAPLGEIPKHLEYIAKKIKKGCGIAENENVLPNILLLVCAAVHEMDCVTLEQLDLDTLSTWVATCNKAMDMGFQVKFVEEHLKKLLHAYLGYHYNFKKEIETEASVEKSEALIQLRNECFSAKMLFEGNRLSHGLFPQ